jgi:transcriptional regulator with XRE-family HTH domain
MQYATTNTLTMGHFGEWLRAARNARGLSLRRLEERIGGICTYSYLSQLENGETGKKGNVYRPDREIVVALARALDVPVDEALIAADYAPTRTHTINGYKVELPYGIDFVIPHTEVNSQDEADEFAESVRLAVEIVKARLARQRLTDEAK